MLHIVDVVAKPVRKKRRKITTILIVGGLVLLIVVIALFAILPPARIALRRLLNVLMSYVSSTDEHVLNMEEASTKEVDAHVAAASDAVDRIDAAHRDHELAVKVHETRVDREVARISTEANGSRDTHEELSRDVARVLGANYVEPSNQ